MYHAEGNHWIHWPTNIGYADAMYQIQVTPGTNERHICIIQGPALARLPKCCSYSWTLRRIFLFTLYWNAVIWENYEYCFPSAVSKPSGDVSGFICSVSNIQSKTPKPAVRPVSVAQSDACSTGDQEVAEIDHEIFSMVILYLPLIQERKLSVTCERMCTEYWLTT